MLVDFSIKFYCLSIVIWWYSVFCGRLVSLISLCVVIGWLWCVMVVSIISMWFELFVVVVDCVGEGVKFGLVIVKFC